MSTFGVFIFDPWKLTSLQPRSSTKTNKILGCDCNEAVPAFMQRFASEKIPKIITKVLIVFLKTCIAAGKGKIEEEGERFRKDCVTAS